MGVPRQPKRVVIAGIAALVVFSGLMALGFWQLQRLQWKRDIIGRITAGMSAPPEIMARSYTPAAEFRHVVAFGSLQVAKPLYVYGRTLDGTAGVHVIAPLIRPGAPPVLVDRGFTPLPLDPTKAMAPSTSRIEGILRMPAGGQVFDPPNQPDKNEWFTIDPPKMALALGLGDVSNFYVEATVPTGPNSPTPTGNRILTNIPNNHLQYAITWFGLAGVCAVIYAVWAVQPGTRQKEKAA